MCCALGFSVFHFARLWISREAFHFEWMMIFIRRRGLHNLNRGLPACPTINILKVFNISYIVIVFTLLCNGAKRCGV